MKRQTLTLIFNNSSDRQILLSAGVLSLAVNGALTLSVNAQESFLPPEVIPMNHPVTYNSAAQNINTSPASFTPATVNNAQALQTPQEARQALYHSLMGNNIYPQFTGQNNNQNNNMNANQAFNPNQNFNQSIAPQNMPQTWTTQMNSQDNMSIAQNNNSNIAPNQGQTLSGNVATQNTSQQRTTGGISHAAGPVAGMGMNLYALSGMRSAGGAYSAGLLGAGLLNYGLRSGFRF